MQFFNFEPLISFLSFIFSFHQLWCTSFDQALRNFWLKALLLKKWHMKLKRHHDIICINKTNIYHYRWFWDFWFGNCKGLKNGEMGCFTFQIIISNHKTSFKKFHKKFENWQKISLILLTESQFSWTFFALN